MSHINEYSIILYSQQNGVTCEIYYKDHTRADAIVSAEDFISDLLTIPVKEYVPIEDKREFMKRYAATHCKHPGGKEERHQINEGPSPWAYAIDTAVNAVANKIEVDERFEDNLRRSKQFAATDALIWRPITTETLTILDCYGDSWEEPNNYADIQQWLNDLTENGAVFSGEAFSAFIFTSALAVPPCEAHLVRNKFIGKFRECYPASKATATQVLKEGFTGFALQYSCETMCDAIIALLHYFATVGLCLKQCQYCRKWFFTQSKTDEKYCRRVTKGKTCGKLAAQEKRNNRTTAVVNRRYNSVCTSLDHWINAKKIEFDEEEKDRRRKVKYSFQEQYRQQKKQLNNEDLIEWMDAYLKNKGEVE